MRMFTRGMFPLLAIGSLLPGLLPFLSCSDSKSTNPESTAEPRIVFNSRRLGDAQLFSMKLDGSDVQPITSVGSSTFGSLSGLGDRVTYSSTRNGQQDIYVADIDGSNELQLTDTVEADFRPAFDPSGQRIAFVSEADAGHRDIWLINADGSNPARLLEIDGSEWHASWTPDGQSLVYYSEVTGDREIYSVGIDGSNLTNLTNDPSADFKTCTLIGP